LTFIATEFARLGLKEPDIDQVIYIPARTRIADLYVTEDYDVGDNATLISSVIVRSISISWQAVEESFDIDTRIRSATLAFVAMKSYDQSEDSQAIGYAASNDSRSVGMRFLRF
jgi:hypothetical protein